MQPHEGPESIFFFWELIEKPVEVLAPFELEAGLGAFVEFGMPRAKKDAPRVLSREANKYELYQEVRTDRLKNCS